MLTRSEYTANKALAATSRMHHSTFYADGYQDYMHGHPYSPPQHPNAHILKTEYVQGWAAGIEAYVNATKGVD